MFLLLSFYFINDRIWLTYLSQGSIARGSHQTQTLKKGSNIHKFKVCAIGQSKAAAPSKETEKKQKNERKKDISSTCTMRSCAKCREDIVAGQEFLNALDEDWHKECFVCNSCSKPFQGSFTMGDDGLPMHEDCFQKREKDKAKSCPICHGKLMPGEPILETGSGQEYHQRCFKCNKCKKTFEGNSYVMEGEKPYHLECATTDAFVKNEITDESLATERCHGCGGQIESSRKIVPGLGHYHPKCFVCDTCRKSIAEKSYYVHPTTREPTCDRCIQKYK